METLTTLWSACWPTLLIFTVLALAVLVVAVWKACADVQAELQGAYDGADESPRPQLTAVLCCGCGKRKCADGYWRPAYMVALPPAWAQTSHGLCPACLAVEMSKLPKPAAV